MATTIDREETQRLVRDGALLVEVLPRSAWEKLHLAGAASAPLDEIDRAWVEAVPADRPIVVYCADHQ